MPPNTPGRFQPIDARIIQLFQRSILQAVDSLIENKCKDIDVYQFVTMLENTWCTEIPTSRIINFWKYRHIFLVLFDNIEAKEALMKDRESQEGIHKTNLEEVTTLLEQLVSIESEIGSTMNVHEFINYSLEFYLNNPSILIEGKIICMLDGRNNTINNESIKK